MPLYPFYCKRCQKNFEIFLRLSETNPKMACPYCNGNEVDRTSEAEENLLTSGICEAQKDS